MDEKINLTDKNISIKTTNGTVVNVTCSYAEDKTLEALFYPIWSRKSVVGSNAFLRRNCSG